MDTFISLNKKNINAEEYIIKEKFGEKEYVYTFKNKDDLVNYIKDNIPVADKNYAVTIDNDLSGTQKLLLKHSAEKAALYQKKNGFDLQSYELKKSIMDTLSDEKTSIEEKTVKISETTKEYQSPDSPKKINKALCAIMSEYCINIYEQIFGPLDNPTNKDGAGANEKVLLNLRSTLNLLIQNDYTSHSSKGKAIDLIILRNNLSRIFMNKMYKAKKLVSKKNENENENNSGNTK
ncbi:hypothetical protein KA977_00985 [Candidatus Dependentiae bacterium]|nr:hypothetical protein [Candidatus Dependentiae bacterium]